MRTPAVHEFVIVMSGLFGLVIGSFLSVVTSRVPRGESIVRPNSHCPKCGNEIQPYDNIPLLSYAVLGGRCRSCSVHIPLRYPLLEATTSGCFAVIAWRVASPWVIPPFCVLAAGLIAVSVIDIDHMRVPSPVLFVTAALAAPLLLLASVETQTIGHLLYGLFAGVAGFALLFGIRQAHPEGLGFGDVKLVALTSFCLGWLDPRGAGLAIAGVALLLGVALACAFSVVRVARGAATLKARLPFAPFLSAGALVAVCIGPTVVKIWIG